jgi:hypothetical protein
MLSTKKNLVLLECAFGLLHKSNCSTFCVLLFLSWNFFCCLDPKSSFCFCYSVHAYNFHQYRFPIFLLLEACNSQTVASSSSVSLHCFFPLQYFFPWDKVPALFPLLILTKSFHLMLHCMICLV